MSSKALLTVFRSGQTSRSITLHSKHFDKCPHVVASRGIHVTKTSLNNSSVTSPTSSADGTSAMSINAQGQDQTGGQSATISKAMTAYLQRAQEHQEFIDKEEKEFVFGRRHLANMMGKDPETFSQHEINEAIRYLFPSGLYEPKARPMMKPPQEIYPRQKAAQFDMSGRPHHPFFYTAKPNFFFILHEMVGKLSALNASFGGSTTSPIDEDNVFSGSVWISKEDMESRLLEKLSDKEYSEWVSCMERLVCHPKRDKELDFIKAYRKPLAKQSVSDDVPLVTLEADGRKSCYIPVCMRKSARGEVKVTLPGTGQFNINGVGLEYFKLTQARESVIAPLQLSGWLGKVDVEAYVTGGTENAEHLSHPGETARAGCVRYGITAAISALGADTEKLRLAGFLTRDARIRERTKCGRTGARATWTWKKR